MFFSVCVFVRNAHAEAPLGLPRGVCWSLQDVSGGDRPTYRVECADDGEERQAKSVCHFLEDVHVVAPSVCVIVGLLPTRQSPPSVGLRGLRSIRQLFERYYCAAV